MGTPVWMNAPSIVYLSASNAPLVSGGLGDIHLLKDLAYLNLDLTTVMGTIPPSIGLLPLEEIHLSKTSLTGPIPNTLGLLNATLTILDLSFLGGASNTIPTSIGDLHKLVYLDLQSCHLDGEIPASFAHLTELESLYLHDNSLIGPLPDIRGTKSLILNACGNHLSGTIPYSLTSRVSNLFLIQNELGPDLNPEAFLTNRNLVSLALSQNLFVAPLPRIASDQVLIRLDLSYNLFYGEIPTDYGAVGELVLSHNNLSGSVDKVLHHYSEILESAFFEHNSLTGEITSLKDVGNLRLLSCSNNLLEGQLPILPSLMDHFSASHNRFDDFSEAWLASIQNSSLKYLDLSNNIELVSHHSFMEIVGPKLTYLSIAHTKILGPLRMTDKHARSLTGLDLTNVGLTGAFPAHIFPSMVVLKISWNKFTGVLDLQSMPSLTQLDMSNNNFDFDVALFRSLPLLTDVNARKNLLHGALVLSNLPSIQYADFSDNELDYNPDLTNIGQQFKNSLRMLNISKNAELKPIPSFDTTVTGLNRSSTNSPSSLHPRSVICYDLRFWNESGRTFSFDEGLFEYRQCDCNRVHFGLPPHKCLKCPSSGTTSCGGTLANISSTSYAFLLPIDPSDTGSHNPSVIDASPSVGWLSSLLSPLASPSIIDPSVNDTEDIMRYIRIETESCLVSVIQMLSGKSNCQGIPISADVLSKSNASWTSISSLLSGQCNNGSEGRLCSRCICSPEGHSDCWYMSGAQCKQCSRVFGLASSIPLVLGMVGVLILVLSMFMAVLLQRRRIQSLQRYAQLPLVTRIIQRFLLLTSLGNVSILITFAQLLLEFTQWDAYAQLEILGIINGGTQGYVTFIWIILASMNFL